LWDQFKRVIAPTGVILLTATQPFSSIVVTSNLSMFKYDWIWEKASAKGHLNAKKQPMRAHEHILVFYNKFSGYTPIKTYGHIRKYANKPKELNSEVYNPNTKDVLYDSTERYPRSVIKFSQDTQKSSLHPTQKPIALMEYLLKTYTKEGNMVLDPVMGSGSMGVACVNLNRDFIGIEKEEIYFNIAKKRIGEI
jgi:DNA modification methylase